MKNRIIKLAAVAACATFLSLFTWDLFWLNTKFAIWVGQQIEQCE